MDALAGVINQTDPESSGVASVYVAADMNKVIVAGFGKRVWVSSSRGSSFRPVDFPEYVDIVTAHYELADAFLFDAYGDACFDYRVLGPCTKSLYVTKDLLATPPVRIASDVRQFGWGAKSRIFVTTWETEQRNASIPRTESELAVMVSDSQSAPYVMKPFVSHALGFVATPNTVFVAGLADDGARGLQLYRSGGRG